MPETYGQTNVTTAKIIEHAVRRVGISPEQQTPDLLELAKDNLFFLLSSFTTRGLPLWCVEQVSVNVSAGEERYECPVGTVDVLMVNMTINGNDLPLSRINRDQYFLLPDKHTPGIPSQYWYDRQLTPSVIVWPVPNTSAITLKVIRKRAIADVGSLTETLSIPVHWIEAVICQLAKRLAISLPGIDPGRIQLLIQQADVNQIEVESDDVDKAPLTIAPDISVYTG